MKRIFDLLVSGVGLCLLTPLLAAIAFAIWLEDRQPPWYRGVRVGQDGVEFRMVKFRTMRVDAWKNGVNSTASGDPRITVLGGWLRRLKLDELPQLWNVWTGEMSLVGPRPQVPTDAALYTREEWRIVSIRPGITDLASIVFADEGTILSGSGDPDLLYNQIVRPWKSRLALLYVDHASFALDLAILLLTLLSPFSRATSLRGVDRILARWSAEDLVRSMARREKDLLPYPPPGAREIVRSYRTQSA